MTMNVCNSNKHDDNIAYNYSNLCPLCALMDSLDKLEAQTDVEREELQSEIDTLENDLAKAEDELVVKEREAEEHAGSIAELQKQIDDLQMQLDDANDSIAALLSDLALKEQEVNT